MAGFEPAMRRGRVAVELTPSVRRDYRPVPGFPGYFVNRRGDILSTNAQGCPEGYAYPVGKKSHGASPSCICAVRPNRSMQHLTTAKLLLLTWAGPPPSDKHVAGHLNGDTHDNRLDNLRWCTREELVNLAIMRGRGIGRQDTYNRFTDDDVEAIRSLAYEAGQLPHQLAVELEADVCTIVRLIADEHRVDVGDIRNEVPEQQADEEATQDTTPHKSARKKSRRPLVALTADVLREYKPIPEFDGYWIDRCGAAISTRGRHMPEGYARPLRNKFSTYSGARSVVLCLFDGQRKRTHTVGSLVLRTWVGPPSGAACLAGHLNGDADDNRLDNLRWCTWEEIRALSMMRGKHAHGDKCSCSKLTSNDVRAIRALAHATGWSAYKLSFEIGELQSTVTKILTGKTWAREL